MTYPDGSMGTPVMPQGVYPGQFAGGQVPYYPPTNGVVQQNGYNPNNTLSRSPRLVI